MRWLIRTYTEPGDLILDPFAGSGTTAVACIAEDRQFIAIEREPEYCAIAERRIAQARRAYQPALAL
jgi:DNA modification methylase